MCKVQRQEQIGDCCRALLNTSGWHCMITGRICRYSGYCAWRGVMTDAEAPEAAAALRRAYPNLGSAIYFEIAKGTHGVLYELPRQRLNWLW